MKLNGEPDGFKVPNIDTKKWEILVDGIVEAGQKAGIPGEEIFFYLVDFLSEMAKAAGKDLVVMIQDKKK